jgi:excisionase family DNA binding protein
LSLPESELAIRDLATHDSHYVTVAELAQYWAVSRRQIYKRIESGALDAIRLGSRLYRVRTRAALEYERRVSVTSTEPTAMRPTPKMLSAKLPARTGLRRVIGRDTKTRTG